MTSLMTLSALPHVGNYNQLAGPTNQISRIIGCVFYGQFIRKTENLICYCFGNGSILEEAGMWRNSYLSHCIINSFPQT